MLRNATFVPNNHSKKSSMGVNTFEDGEKNKKQLNKVILQKINYYKDPRLLIDWVVLSIWHS